MAFNQDHFKNIVSRNGFVRKFYETLKTGTYEGIIDRIFVTGVTSMTLDSLTSGFNIGANLTLEAELGHMLGFTEEEVKEMIAILNPEAPIEELIRDMRYYYNGYHFAGNPAERVYNPDMVLYFLKHYQRHQNYPEQILDVNIASDYGKIRRLFKLRNPEQNNEILQKIVSLGAISGNITAQFSFEKEFEEDDFLSLLFYMGYLTIQGEVVGLKKFVVPNYVIRKLFIEYFAFLLREQEQIPYKASEVKEALIEMAMQGNPAPFFKSSAKSCAISPTGITATLTKNTSNS
ncbi:MAG: AAA family ATPase [Microscillaceae bacterium]|nr:AAA family ATPase [Microscillaceae bacterium]